MRLDNYLFENAYFDSRTKAKQAIERGEIFIDGKLIDKPSYEVPLVFNKKIEHICKEQFVSLGGYKLNKALKDFSFNVNEFICADIGASTGGFTDCLLQNGAKKVFAVDLNDELLHYKLKSDNRVQEIIANAKNLSRNNFPDKLDLIVADLSFISITSVIDVFDKLLDDRKYLLLLIKPQFESGERRRHKNGVIRDKKLQINACINVYDVAVSFGFCPINFTTAPIHEDKNVEFLMLFEKNGKIKLQKEQLTF